MGSTSKKHKKDKDMARKHKHKSRSRSRSRSPISPEFRDRNNDRNNERNMDRERINDRERMSDRERINERERRHHRKHHSKDSMNRRYHRRSPEREEYHSDSSDVVEVPIAPPAPTISKPSRSPSPIPEGGVGDCLSIFETNKLRAKLGLKPLDVDTGPKPGEESKDGDPKHKDEWGEFYHKPADNMGDKTYAEKIRNKLKERKEKRMIDDKMTKIKGLGESDEDVDDLSRWVSTSRQKQKSKDDADKRAKLLEEMDAEFGVGNLIEQDTRDLKRDVYNKNHLKGLRVEHDTENFQEGKTIILTLKDQDVLNEDDDALINVNLIDDERYKKNIENKKQNPQHYGYDVYADEILDEFGQPTSRPILKKYDEEIDADHGKKTFTIGENLDEEKEKKRKLLEIKCKLANKKLESLDQTLKIASDYYNETELASFKKPKKKVKKLRQKLKADDLLQITNETNGQGSSKEFVKRKRDISDIIDTDDSPAFKEDLSNIKIEDDDDDLQQVLSKARRLKQKEAFNIKQLPLEMTQVKPEIKMENDKSDDDSESQIGRDGNIVLNATAEFCRTLGDIPTYGMAGNRDDEPNDMMDFEQDEDDADHLEDEDMPSTKGTWSSVNPDAEIETPNHTKEVAEIAILDEEPDVSAGVAGALRLAMSKGYLEKDETNRPSTTRMAHLQAKNYSIEDKAYGEDEKFGRRDRYHSGPTMDFKEKDTFKPNVKLEYIDDNGRVLNAKEAFRYLSHKFHGKGPGKNKIEKRLKKQEQDGLMMKMSSTDTPLGTLNMLQQKQKETQSPYIVLSGSKQTHASASLTKHKMK